LIAPPRENALPGDAKAHILVMMKSLQAEMTQLKQQMGERSLNGSVEDGSAQATFVGSVQTNRSRITEHC
jgi:hypothetical protein